MTKEETDKLTRENGFPTLEKYWNANSSSGRTQIVEHAFGLLENYAKDSLAKVCNPQIESRFLKCGCCGHLNPFTPDCEKCDNKL